MVFLRRLWIQLTSDRKRFAALCAVVALGMLLWARLILVSKLPRTAVADDPAAAVQGSDAGTGAVGAAPDAGAPTGPDSDKPALPAITVRLGHAVRRDPFIISPDYFPRPTLATRIEAEAGKSPGEPVEDAQTAEARRLAQLQALADRFRLEAVMQGSPMAVINGRTYRLHDWIDAVDAAPIQFQLVDVGQRSATLECRGCRFELTIQTPVTPPD